jgi:hypothetical protein
VLDTLIDERLDHHFRAGHFLLHRPLRLAEFSSCFGSWLNKKGASNRDPCAPPDNE